jgi:hypothetical protein
MIELEHAKHLYYGQYIYSLHEVNSKDGSAQRWRVTGQVIRWKRQTDRIRVPIKTGGMYGTNDHLENDPDQTHRNNLQNFSLIDPTRPPQINDPPD